jgi:hypothetical protein
MASKSKLEEAPPELVQLLERFIPDFSEEGWKHQIATMLWQFTIPQRRHRHYQHSVYISYEEMAKLFNRRISNFKDCNRFEDAGRYFNVLRHSNASSDKANNHTNGYEPRPWMKLALEIYISSELTNTLKDGRGIRHKPLKAISNNDYNGTRLKQWQGIDVTPLVPAKVQNLELMVERYLILHQAYKQGLLPEKYKTHDPERFKKLNKSIPPERFEDLASQAKALLQLARKFDGHVPIQYVQSGTGRLYAQRLNLQTCKRELRHAAMEGYWDYDIAACHFAIMAQMAEKLGKRFPVLERYVNNKSQIRKQLSQDLNLKEGKIKKVLTAIAYGARSSKNPAHAIPAEIGEESAKELYVHPVYAELKGEISKAVSFILEKQKPNQRGLVNAHGRLLIYEVKGNQLKVEVIPRHTKMAHLLQGVEAEALQAAVKACSDKVILLQHDGFSTSEPVDPLMLNRVVRDSIGYDLVFEEDKIEMPYPDFESDFSKFKTKLQIPPKPSIHAGLDEFWDHVCGTVGYGLRGLLPLHPHPLPEIETPF